MSLTLEDINDVACRTLKRETTVALRPTGEVVVQIFPAETVVMRAELRKLQLVYQRTEYWGGESVLSIYRLAKPRE